MKKDFIKYFIPIILLCFIGIISIYCSKSIVNNYMYFFKRQIIYVVIGIILLLFFKYINFNIIYKYSFLIYLLIYLC